MADTAASESTVEMKPAKEIIVVHDEGFFKHDTGDTYEGFFEAKKKDRSVKMNGRGIYTTAEGDVYSGQWESDRLRGEDVTITYEDSSKFTGSFKDWSYYGPGIYQYPDNSILKCEFVDSVPVGNMALIDPNSHTWLGKAEQGFGWLEPINHYYDMLEKTREGKIKRGRHRIDSNFGSTLKKIKTPATED